MNAKKKNLALAGIAVLLVAVLVAAAVLYQKFSGEYAGENLGSTEEAQLAAPDFTVLDSEGNEVQLSDYVGKPIVLNFWATWCPPCRQELTRVQKDIIDRFAGRNFVFLPISRGEKREDVAAFREKTGYTFPMGLDPSQAIYDRYASNYIPRNFLIGADGKVVLATVGYDAEEFDEMIKTIEKILE